MSALQVGGVAFPRLGRGPLAAPLAVPGSRMWATRLVEDGRLLARYCLKYCVLVLAAFGLTQLRLAVGDGPLAPFHNLPPECRLGPQCVSASSCVLPDTTPQARWEALAPALAILDEVHPDTAQWVRDTERRGKLLFANRWTMGGGRFGCLARYDAFDGRLTICPGLFAESDGRIATILCHEYRHSRQQFSKTLLYALSFVLIRGGDPAIVENDAKLFEQEAQLAVFGSYQEP